MPYWPLPPTGGYPVPQTLFHAPPPNPYAYLPAPPSPPPTFPQPPVTTAPSSSILRAWGNRSLANPGVLRSGISATYPSALQSVAPAAATQDAVFASAIRPFMPQVSAPAATSAASAAAYAPPLALPPGPTPMALGSGTPLALGSGSTPLALGPGSTSLGGASSLSTPLAAMPADTAFANSLAGAVGGGGVGRAASSLPGFMESGLASGISNAARAQGAGIGGRAGLIGRGALGSLAPYMAGSAIRYGGESLDSPQGNVLEGFGLGAQGGSVFGAPGALVGATGVGIGNTATALAPVQDYVINPLRRLMGKEDTTDTFVDLFKNGGALSGMPLLGEGDKAGTQQQLAQQLAPDVLHSKLDQLNLSPDARAKFVQDFNDQATLLRISGVPNDQAMAATYQQFFGGVDAEGKPAAGLAGQYLASSREGEAAKAAAENKAHEDALRAVALQGLVATLAPQYVQPMQDAATQYTASMGNIIPQLPAYMQPIAQKQVADFSVSQPQRIADQYAFYHMLPAQVMAAQSQEALKQQQMLAQIELAQARAEKTREDQDSGGQSGVAGLVNQAQGK